MNTQRKLIQMSSHLAGDVDKTYRYKWITSDKPGVFQMIKKTSLHIEKEYQRDQEPGRIIEITKSWSWVRCGVLIVCERDGVYWVVDGQHRLMGSMRRSDIDALPCLVFTSTGIKEEASRFYDINTDRKAVSAIAKHRALLAAGDKTAAQVQHELDLLDLRIVATATSAGHLKCIGWCMSKCAENPESFRAVLELVTTICNLDSMPVSEKLCQGFWYLNQICEGGVRNKRLWQRSIEKGGRVLLTAATRAAAIYAAGGLKVFGEGMLTEINKGLRTKIEVVNK